MKPSEINASITIPEERKFISIKEDEAAFLYDFIQEHDLKSTLETGLGFGRSATHILMAHGRNHIAIDPFQSDYDYLALNNVASVEAKDRFEFYEDHSHNVLPQLFKEKNQFDLIFIDGDHKFDGILIDFYFADLLLEINGFIVFHDTWMRSTQLVAAFIKKNRSNYKEVKAPLRNFLIFQKRSKEDGRDGMHFKEFYNQRSRLKFKVISWLVSPGDSFLKRMVLKLKHVFK
ncbi:MAG: class I SAM-dependent methyltransferase [Bacteroidetes bacterium]|nr:class I SAM-dependent methyltransferase [Bacteroidota bacterium]